MKVGKIIKRSRKLYSLIKVLRLSKGAELIDVICGTEGVYPIIVHDQGNYNPNRLIYYIARKDQNEGFFAMLRTTLYYLEFADRFHLSPYIKWSDECAYYQKQGYEGRKNPFEYYFKPCSDINEKEIENSKNVVYAKAEDVNVLKEFSLESPYYYSSGFISKMGALLKKYIFLQETIEDQLKYDLEGLFQKFKVLGVHYRGTDFKKNYDSHPVALTPEDYYESIETALKENNYDKIFIATDDRQALKEFQNRFGKKIIYYEDTLRAEGDVSVMYCNANRDNDNFLKGYEVLRDVYSMAHASGLISGVSMVSVFARIVKESTTQTFATDLFLDKGINCNSNKWVTMK